MFYDYLKFIRFSLKNMYSVFISYTFIKCIRRPPMHPMSGHSGNKSVPALKAQSSCRIYIPASETPDNLNNRRRKLSLNIKMSLLYEK